MNKSEVPHNGGQASTIKTHCEVAANPGDDAKDDLATVTGSDSLADIGTGTDCHSSATTPVEPNTNTPTLAIFTGLSQAEVQPHFLRASDNKPEGTRALKLGDEYKVETEI